MEAAMSDNSAPRSSIMPLIAGFMPAWRQARCDLGRCQLRRVARARGV